MQRMLRGFLLSVTLLVLTSCGGLSKRTSSEVSSVADTTAPVDSSNITPITDTTAPVITLVGDNPQNIELNSAYVELIATSDDGSNVTIDSSEVNISKIGTYSVRYNATDAKGNTATEIIRTVNVRDTLAPVFTSEVNITVDENQKSAITLVATGASTYSIAEAQSDNFDLNATTGVVMFKVAPDFETLATYTFKATATDTSGNKVTQNIIIHISDIEEIQAPKKTGQTKSYYAKDDGDYQKGTTASYTRDDTKNIVIDHVTGLEWQDDIETKTIRKNWADAKIYCTNLALDSGGWRLPTRKELIGILDYGRKSVGIDATFINVYAYLYWSSTVNVDNPNGAWNVYFSSGGHQNLGSQSGSYYVRCIRRKQP